MSRETPPPYDLLPSSRGAGRREALAVSQELKRRFARFRRENPRNTRVPDDLRAAVLAAIGRGVTPGLLRRTCGLSTGQLTRWRKSSRALAASSAPSREEPARVFSLIGAATTRPPEVPPHPPADGLELRLGPWSVCVRLAPLTEITRR